MGLYWCRWYGKAEASRFSDVGLVCLLLYAFQKLVCIFHYPDAESLQLELGSERLIDLWWLGSQSRLVAIIFFLFLLCCFLGGCSRESFDIVRFYFFCYFLFQEFKKCSISMSSCGVLSLCLSVLLTISKSLLKYLLDQKPMEY